MGAIKVLLWTGLVAVLSLATLAFSLPVDGDGAAELLNDNGVADADWQSAAEMDEPGEAPEALHRSTLSDAPGLAEISRQSARRCYFRCNFGTVTRSVKIVYPCFLKNKKGGCFLVKLCNGKSAWKCKCTWRGPRKGGCGRAALSWSVGDGRIAGEGAMMSRNEVHVATTVSNGLAVVR